MYIQDSDIKRLATYSKFLQSNLENYKKLYSLKNFIKVLLIRIIGILGSIKRIKIRAKEIDVLFILNNNSLENKIKPIISILEKKSYTIVVIRNDLVTSLKSLSIGYIPLKVPNELAYTYGEAKYFSDLYDPKVIVMIENQSLLSSFLKRLTNAKTINISHGVRTNLWEHSNIDYDYYFLFGESSLLHLRNNRNLFGKTIPIVTGSPFFNVKGNKVCIQNNKKYIVYFSQYLNKRVENDLLFSNEIFIEFAKNNPERKFIIKLHPLESKCMWANKIRNISNVELSDDDIELFELLNHAFISLVAWSNASIESAIANCPVISIDRSGFANNNLEISNYFPVVKSVNELERAVINVESNYRRYIDVCKDYVAYHVGHVGHSQNYIADIIYDILTNNCKITEEIKESISWK